MLSVALAAWLAAIAQPAVAAAAVRLPSGGLPQGPANRVSLVGAKVPSFGVWGAIRVYALSLGPALPQAGAWAAAEGETGRIGAALVYARLPEGLLADMLAAPDLPAPRAQEVREAFLAIVAEAAQEADQAALRGVMAFQLAVDQGRASAADLFELESQLRSLSIYGGRPAALYEEIRAAAAVQRGHQVAAAYRGRFGAGLEADGVVASEALPRQRLESAAAGRTPRETAVVPAPRIASEGAHGAPQGRAWWRYLAGWSLPIVLGAAVVYGLDFGSKALAAKHLPTLFHEAAWRGPILAFVMPVIVAGAYMARSGLEYSRSVWSWSRERLFSLSLGWHRKTVAGLDEMLGAHPSLAKAKRLYDVSIALMIGGAFGNAIDVWTIGGAIDFIPFGRSTLNFADVALLLGLAYFQMAGRFFIRAAEAYREKKPLHFDPGAYFALPLAGFVAAWIFGSVKTDEFLSLTVGHPAWVYVMGFAMLLGVSRLIVAVDIARYVRRFREEAGK